MTDTAKASAAWMASKIEQVPVEALVPYARNSRTHSEEQVAQIAASIAEFGFTNPILVGSDGVIVAGHARLQAARRLGLATVPVIRLEHLTRAQRRALVIADNRLAELAGWDAEMLAIELDELRDEDFDLALTGFDERALDELLSAATGQSDDAAGGEGKPIGTPGGLYQRFLFPPFSVLNARSGAWRERKKAWLALGLDSAAGRPDMLVYSPSCQTPEVLRAKNDYERSVGRRVSWDEFIATKPDVKFAPGTSVFDPVLAELMYAWFCPRGGVVLDPFAGGSVRGIVAAKTGRPYIGIDLRQEQVEANRQQWATVGATGETAPRWICGDSAEIASLCGDVRADFLFSCPPYADLEVYSDDPRDLSNMSYEAFAAAYRAIIERSVALLRNDRFAVWVIGEVRNEQGVYRNLVGLTVDAFARAGAQYYNEAVLVTAAGSLVIRAGRVFSASRKLGKTHQNVLVFVKGDARAAAAACDVVEVDDELLEAEALVGADGDHDTDHAA